MRLSLLILGLLGAVITVVLFRVSYDVQGLEGTLSRLNGRIVAEEESIRVLRAEWAYLNRPTRLQELAEQLTELKPVRPDQLILSASVLPMPLPGDDGTAEAAAEPAAPAEPALLASLLVVPGMERLPLPVRKPGSEPAKTDEIYPPLPDLDPGARRHATFVLAADTIAAVREAMPLMAAFHPTDMDAPGSEVDR